MPRIPTQDRGVQRTPFTPRDPGQALAVGNAQARVAQAVGNLAGTGSQLAFSFAEQEIAAKREHETAVYTAQTMEVLNDLKMTAEVDPQIVGSTQRFDESSKESLDALLADVTDRRVKEEVRNRSARLLAATRIEVQGTERKRFNAMAESTMDDLAENYSLAAAFAPNDVAEEEVRGQFLVAIGESQFLPSEKRAALIDGFDTAVSEAKALELLREDPDLLFDTVGDPSLFRGLDAEQRERLTGQALKVANQRAARADRAAEGNIKSTQNNNTRDALIRLMDGEDPEDVRLDILENPEGYSVTNIGVLRTALSTEEAITDDPETVIQLERAVRNGDVDAVDQINSSYIGKSVNSGTRSRLLALDAQRNEPASSPERMAYQFIRNALGPGEEDKGLPRANAALRVDKGIQEMEDFVSTQRSPQEIRAKKRAIVSAYSQGSQIGGEALEDFSNLRVPYGISKPVGQLSQADVDTSDRLIGAALASGQISEELALLLSDNNDAVRPFARTQDALRAQDGQQ